MYFDSHCHLNFKAFDGRVGEVIDSAKKAGVNNIIVPGTDVESSKKAVEITEKYEGVYAAVGIHPHHIFQYFKDSESEFLSHTSQKRKNFSSSSLKKDFEEIEKLLTNPKVVAVGEVGIDRHYYQKTKHENYQVNDEFINLQKDLFIEQIKLAQKYKKSLIIHNREATKDVLDILLKIVNCSPRFAGEAGKLEINMVFHCCEPDKNLLDFAIDHKIFIGVDGDIFYRKDKQEFIKNVPLEMMVLETDSPFLAPDKKFPNEPKNIPLIEEFIAQLLHCSTNLLKKQTTENATKLFFGNKISDPV
jgi:TatD DNase family protein